MKRGILLASAIALAIQALPAAQDAAPPQRRRNQIQMMEGVLTRAVRSGAEDLARRMQSRDPSLMLFTGTARARGFVLEGYGVFFDVEIPALRPTVVWAARTLERDSTMANAIDSLARALAAMPEGPTRLRAEQALEAAFSSSALDRLSGRRACRSRAPFKPQPQSRLSTTPTRPTPKPSRTRSSMRCSTTACRWISAPRNGSRSPRVTAKGRLTPDEIYDASTILIRVKGSDLGDLCCRSQQARRSARPRPGPGVLI